MYDRSTHKNIVFFDGECAVCNRFFAFLEKFDRLKVLSFSTIGGETIKEFSDKIPKDIDSVVYAKEGEVYIRSQAVIRILADVFTFLRFTIPIVSALRFPLDLAYDAFASVRHRLSWGNGSCHVPSVDTRRRILP